jgi:ATP-binding cassette subfamily B protein
VKLLRFLSFKYPVVRQYDRIDCGPAALLSVLKYYKGADNLVHIREITNTDNQGSSLQGLAKGARALGFDAKGVTGQYEDLLQERMPCIAHIIIEDGLQHFVVVYKTYFNSVIIGDPAKGLLKLHKEEFIKMWKRKAVLLIKLKGKVYESNQKGTFNWIKAYLIKDKAWIYQAVFLGILYTIFGLLTAIFIQWLIDRFIPEGNYTKIILTGTILFLLLILRAITGYFRQRFLVILNRKIIININAEFITHLFQLPKKFFDTRKTGDITARINDTIKIQQAIIKIAGTTIIDGLIIIGSFVFIWQFSNILAWISLVFIPIYGSILFFSIQGLKQQQNEVMKSYARAESTYIDSLKGIDDIITYNVCQVFSKLNRSLFVLYQNKLENIGFTQARLSLFSDAYSAIITICLLIAGALLVIQSDLLLGKMMASYALLANMIPAVNGLIDSNISLQGASIASRRLRDLLLVEREKNEGKKLFKMNKSLVMKEGSFAWANNNDVFNNVSIEIKKGRITAIWGPNGSGKSTMVHILQRKYFLDSGSIFVDNLSAQEIDIVDYRKNIGVVPTDVKIFNGTLVDNITLGRPVKSINHLSKIMANNGLAEFVKRFENGFFTLLGEGGRGLSVGEKQMLGVSRAIMNLPEVLILDEGINSIDAHTAVSILDILINYAKCHAVVIITHNLITLTKANYLYILKDGIIFQEGDPRLLIAQEGCFQQAWRLYQNI